MNVAPVIVPRPLKRFSTSAAFSRALFGIVLVMSSVVAADEPLPDVEDGDRSSPRVERKEAPAQADEKLIDALDPAAKRDRAEIERMERAIAGMREAFRRIEADDAGSETLDVQRRVIADLEKLVELLKRRQNESNSQQQNSQQQNQQQQNQQQDRQKLQKPQLDPQNSGQRQARPERGQAGRPERNEDEKSREAQERLNAAKSAQAEEARRQQMVKDVWGHLPPSLRAAMQNAFSDKYLPKYEELVKRYYEALAEKSRKSLDKP